MTYENVAVSYHESSEKTVAAQCKAARRTRQCKLRKEKRSSRDLLQIQVATKDIGNGTIRVDGINGFCKLICDGNGPDF